MQRNRTESRSRIPSRMHRMMLLANLVAIAFACASANAQSWIPATSVADPGPTTPSVQIAKESNIKAVYLYSFGRFTTWPSHESSATDRFVIGVVGNTGVQASLEKIASKRKIQDKPIIIQHYPTASDVAAGDCQLLFIPDAVLNAEATTLIERLRGSSVLIATETLQRPVGTVVNFVPEGTGIQFEIDLEEAKRKQLAMDARLLRQGKQMLRGTEPHTNQHP